MSHLRQQSLNPHSLNPHSTGTTTGTGGTGGTGIGASPALVARINEKKAELENLRQLRDLSGRLADQMGALEEKLVVLGDGTEAVAAVLTNWHSVLQAINLASTKAAMLGNAVPVGDESAQPPLPETLVRIPAEQQSRSLPG